MDFRHQALVAVFSLAILAGTAPALAARPELTGVDMSIACTQQVPGAVSAVVSDHQAGVPDSYRWKCYGHNTVLAGLDLDAYCARAHPGTVSFNPRRYAAMGFIPWSFWQCVRQ
jgi:hypothetical protein